MTRDWDNPRPTRSTEPPPLLDYLTDGSCPLKQFRLRTVLFGFARIEQKVVYRDGRVIWRRYPNWMGSISIAPSDDEAAA